MKPFWRTKNLSNKCSELFLVIDYISKLVHLLTNTFCGILQRHDDIKEESYWSLLHQIVQDMVYQPWWCWVDGWT